MYNYRHITENLYWIGGNDRRIALFENVYPVPEGVSYNAYFADGEQTVIIDTVDKAVAEVFFENLEALLHGRQPDYLIVNHMEPDHAATVADVVRRYPGVCVVCNAKTKVMLSQYFDVAFPNMLLVAEGDTLTVGAHTYTFVMAPMVHWPEVMVTYDTTDKILFSADAFGTFGALDGRLFADQVDFKTEKLSEARRYYTNIVGKYGPQVTTLLKKAAGLEIAMICPLHGPIWRRDIGWFVDKYLSWAGYRPEEQGVVIAYASVYGHTENTAEILASKLSERGVSAIKLYDVSVTDPSYVLSEVFRYSHLVLASTTYNAGIFVKMEHLVRDLAQHNLQNRTVAVIENGTWAATAGELIKKELAGCKNMTFLGDKLTVKSALKPEGLAELDAMADAILESMDMPAPIVHDETKVEQNAMFKLTYGLFVLTAKDGDKDNGCIINTVTQLTDKPKRISIAVNRANYTHDMILKTGVFNVSVLTESAPFSVFERFGFQSGRDTDKFEGCACTERSENGLRYVPKYTNAFISARVVSAEDMGTHTLFIAEVTEAKVLSNEPSVTYAYYFAHIKPKPAPREEKKVGYVCKICGYVYEGDPLPEDFICPLCKHGAEDFEKLA